MRPPEYYGSAAHRVITETPRSYPRNVRECCAPRGPKSPVERCCVPRFFKTAVSHLVGRQRSTLLQTGGESRPGLRHARTRSGHPSTPAMREVTPPPAPPHKGEGSLMRSPPHNGEGSTPRCSVYGRLPAPLIFSLPAAGPRPSAGRPIRVG
jgi:hypothetical protein